MKNAINWFEIPVKNFNRAKKFYETILDVSLQTYDQMPGNSKMAMFPYDTQGGVGGCIMEGQGHEPSKKGVLIYLNGGDNLGIPLARVEKAGGKVVMPKTSIGEHGFMAVFEDTEGNTMAFHSMK